MEVQQAQRPFKQRDAETQPVRAASGVGPAPTAALPNAPAPDDALGRRLADAVLSRASRLDRESAGVVRGGLTRPTLQRLVFWDTSNLPLTVKSITLDRIGSTGGGAHSTSYQLFLEIVQNAVVNADFDTAVGRLEAARKDVKRLPGWDASDAKMSRLSAAMKSTYDDATGASGDAANHSYYLETLASDYVRLRNALAYNYLEAGEGAIGGWSEASHLKQASSAHTTVDWAAIDSVRGTPSKKRKRADDEQIEASEEFITHTAALLDTRNVAPPSKKLKKSKKANPAFGEWQTRWTNIIKQHIGTIIAAHPGVEEDADAIIGDLAQKLGDEIQLSQVAIDSILTDLTASKAGWANIEVAV